MKYWCGLDGQEAVAARACAKGGWIPVSPAVVEHPEFQKFLERQPLFKEFVRLAASPNQVPTPRTVGAALLDRELKLIGGKVLGNDQAPPAEELLEQANRRLTKRIQEARQ